MLRERVRHSMRGKHCGGCGIQTGFDRRGEFREGSQERALQVSRERLGDGVAILGGGRDGGGQGLCFWHREECGWIKLILKSWLSPCLWAGGSPDHSNQLFLANYQEQLSAETILQKTHGLFQVSTMWRTWRGSEYSCLVTQLHPTLL